MQPSPFLLPGAVWYSLPFFSEKGKFPGTCWALAAATVISDVICSKTGIPIDYSAGDLLGCCGPRCGDYNGGYPYYALEYITQKGTVTGGYYGPNVGWRISYPNNGQISVCLSVCMTCRLYGFDALYRKVREAESFDRLTLSDCQSLFDKKITRTALWEGGAGAVDCFFCSPQRRRRRPEAYLLTRKERLLGWLLSISYQRQLHRHVSIVAAL